MRVHVISDVHGRAAALRGAASGADALFCLGDLLLFVDYADEAQGIFAEACSAVDAARQFVALRTAKRFGEARELSAGLWRSLGGDPARHVRDAASRQYAEMFAALPASAYLTYGNVDIPPWWAEHLRPGHHVLDGERVELGGRTFRAFVGGGLHSPYRDAQQEIDADDRLRGQDSGGQRRQTILCTHIPPAVPELLYDDGRAAAGARPPSLTCAGDQRSQPRYVLFGHVHQPLARRVRVGRTECVNVGHFRATGTPYVLAW